MSKPRTPAGGSDEQDSARATLDELRTLAEAMDPDFSFFCGRMNLLRLDLATVAHALARAGAIEDARRAVTRVKSSARRGPVRAIALAQAERGEADAARQTALELPPTGPNSARSTRVEIAGVLARRGDFAEAVRTAEELEDADPSARSLAGIANLQAEVEVGNFANARAVPESHSPYGWVALAKLFAQAGSHGRAATADWALTLRRMIERARAIPKAGDRSATLEIAVHNLAWAGDAAGAVLAAQANDGTARQEKALAKVVAGLAGRGDFAAVEPVLAGIKGKGPRAEAQTQLRAAQERAGGPLPEPFPDEPWTAMLKEAEQLEHPDERLNRIALHVAFHPYPEDARRAVGAALLRVRQALTDGGESIRAAGLSRTEVLAGADTIGAQVKGRGRKPGAESHANAVRAARLCRIAGALGTMGDFAAGAETAGRIKDGDFRACALALALSGALEFQERLRHARMNLRGRTPPGSPEPSGS